MSGRSYEALTSKIKSWGFVEPHREMDKIMVENGWSARPLSNTWCPECDKVGFLPGEWEDSRGICKRCYSKWGFPPGVTKDFKAGSKK